MTDQSLRPCYVLRLDANGDWSWLVLDDDARVVGSGTSKTRQLAERQARGMAAAPVPSARLVTAAGTADLAF